MNYETALNFLSGKEKKRVNHETYIVKQDNFVGVKYHSTFVIKFYPTHFVVNSGGHMTATTKRRINLFMPCGSIFQKNFVWFIKLGDMTTEYKDNTKISYGGVMVKTIDKNEDMHLKSHLLIKDKKFDEALVILRELQEKDNGDRWVNKSIKLCLEPYKKDVVSFIKNVSKLRIKTEDEFKLIFGDGWRSIVNFGFVVDMDFMLGADLDTLVLNEISADRLIVVTPTGYFSVSLDMVTLK